MSSDSEKAETLLYVSNRTMLTYRSCAKVTKGRLLRLSFNN